MNLIHAAMAAFLPALALSSGTSRDAQIRARLQAFDKNPDAVLQRRARVFAVTQAHEPLGLDASYRENDLPTDLVDELKYSDLGAMEEAGLLKAQLQEQPWSGDFWPVYRGMIAKRYTAEAGRPSGDWKKNYDRYLENAEASSVDELAPSEKYDLLVGDDAHTLTNAMWEEGRPYHEKFSTVEHWMGLCHGWAPASYMVPRPTHAVEVLAADGKTKIRFYPDDVKALATLLWAKAPGKTRLIGARCNEKKPERDQNGRVLNPDCFDTNPGTWHLVAVNQIGHSHRAFAMDSAFDYQVWNQPLLSYSYTYFNPETREPVESLEKARIELKDFSQDKFQKYRSADAVAVVGVAMDVTYMIENPPTHKLTDGPEADSHTTVTYLYDVELDQADHIIGGEWYEKLHPDFLFTPEPGSRAMALGDRLLKKSHDQSSWDGNSPMPDLWQKAAVLSSERGEPLGHVIEGLVTISRAGL